MAREVSKNLAKKIAYWLAFLPDSSLLTLVKTREQLRTFFGVRYMQTLASSAWTARFTGKNDPLQPLLKSGEIDSDTYDRVWLWVDFLEQLWGLIQLAEPYVKAEFEHLKFDYPFASAFELFMRIVWEQTNAKFSVCLKPYHEVSASKYEKAYRLTAKGCREGLNRLEHTRQQACLNQHQPNEWMRIVLAICHQKATKRRRALKSKLETFNLALANLCDKEATVRRKAGSYAWQNGEILTGSRDSTYKSS